MKAITTIVSALSLTLIGEVYGMEEKPESQTPPLDKQRVEIISNTDNLPLLELARKPTLSADFANIQKDFHLFLYEEKTDLAPKVSSELGYIISAGKLKDEDRDAANAIASLLKKQDLVKFLSIYNQVEQLNNLQSIYTTNEQSENELLASQTRRFYIDTAPYVLGNVPGEFFDPDADIDDLKEILLDGLKEKKVFGKIPAVLNSNTNVKSLVEILQKLEALNKKLINSYNQLKSESDYYPYYLVRCLHPLLENPSLSLEDLTNFETWINGIDTLREETKSSLGVDILSGLDVSIVIFNNLYSNMTSLNEVTKTIQKLEVIVKKAKSMGIKIIEDNISNALVDPRALDRLDKRVDDAISALNVKGEFGSYVDLEVIEDREDTPWAIKKRFFYSRT